MLKVFALIAAAALIVGVAVVVLVMQQPSGSTSVELILSPRKLTEERTLTYTVLNKGPKPVYLGEPYDIQVWVGGEWVSVEWLKDVVWIAVLYVVEPGGSLSRQIQIPEDADAGRYRLVKKVYVDDAELVLTAEFEVAG